ncbi:alpha/beta fold hydrolase [Nocardia sp. NPDC052278]|uniref:alpha/beta fold hydrolase n=1 Tax=unclassified Nocardia TaxID=2637762 RepID=UPI0036B7C5BF
MNKSVTTGSVVSPDGTTITYDSIGEGPPIICVDGAFCTRTFGPMPKVAPLLAHNFRVITYDRRARGDSGDTKPYAVDREIEDLEALIKEMDGSAHVFGLSSGAALSLRAAASGLNITKLALYEPPFVGVDKTGHQPPVDGADTLNRLIASDRRGEAVTFYLSKIIGLPAVVPAIMRLMPMWPKMKAVAPSLPYDATIMADFALPKKQLSSITVPTLVVGGAKSPASLRMAVQAVADAVPGGRWQMLDRQNHNVSAKALAPVLDRFFATAAEPI